MIAKRPLLAAALGMASGIALSYLLADQARLWIVLVVGGLGLAACAMLLTRRFRAVLAALLGIVGFVAGVLRYDATALEAPPPPNAEVIAGRVQSVRARSGTINDYVLSDVRCFLEDGSMERLSGRLIVYSVSLEEPALPGQVVTIEKTSIFVPDGPSNPGGFNRRMYLWNKGVSYTAAATDARAWVSGEPDGFEAALTAARLDISDRIDALFPHPTDAAMMRGLLLGDSGDLDEEVYESFSVLGTAHVLAVSGLHVGFIVLLLGGALRGIWMLLPRRYAYLWGKLRLPRAAFLSILLLGYGALVGFSPSVTRALVMGILLEFSGAVGRRRDSANTLALAAIIVLLIQPMDMFAASMQLSFGAVAGIFLYDAAFRERLTRFPRGIASSLSMTMAAQIGTLPVLMLTFGRIPLLGLLSNLFAVPLSAGATMAAIPVVLLDYALPGAAKLLANIPGLAARLLAAMSSGAARVPFTSMEIAAPSALLMLGYYAMFLLLSRPIREGLGRYKKPILAAFGFFFIFAFAQWTLSLYPAAPEATVLSVGSGQAVALRSKSAMILVDCGAQSFSAARDYARFYGKDYDAVVLTGGDSGRTGALAALVEDGHAKSVYVPASVLSAGNDALDAAARAGAAIYAYQAGDTLILGGMRLRAIEQAESPWERPVVLSLDVGGESQMLVMGNLALTGEKVYDFPRTRLLVAPNRGAQGSCGDYMLARALPDAAILSASTRFFGAAGTYERLRYAVPNAYRTDESGAITVRFGKALSVKTWGRER